MGRDPKREPPFFFQKPADAIQPIAEGEVGAHPYPPLTSDYHHEIELVVFLASGGRDIAPADADAYIAGYGARVRRPVCVPPLTRRQPSRST